MKILYLTMAPVDEASGVFKKVEAQVASFERLNCECRILFVEDGENIHYYKDGVIHSNVYGTVINEVKEYLASCDFCYARFELLRHKKYKAVIDMCRKSKIKIVLEIPTFPPYQERLARAKGQLNEKKYLSALKTFAGALVVNADMMCLANMASLVCIVADDYKFKKTKTIRIENGIDLKKNQYVSYTEHETISIVAVSNFAIWNGYDRVIKGMYQYRQQASKRRIKLILVGPLDKARNLKKLVSDYNLEDCVEFTGALSGESLDSVYRSADIALGALGNHRRKVFANSSLKAKEYSARGMLMVLSDAEGIEKEIFDKSLIVKSDESPIDFNKVVEWFDDIADKEQVKREIHNFAVKHYAWDSQMKKVIDGINADQKEAGYAYT